MAQKKEQDAAAPEAAVSDSGGPPKMERVKVSHYKIFTSQGRFLDGEITVLPVSEVEDLVELGHVKRLDE